MKLIEELAHNWWLIGPFAVCLLPIYIFLNKIFGKKNEQKETKGLPRDRN